MMSSVAVGLDIGRTSIKAVRFRRSWNGRETADFFHHPFHEAGDLGPKDANSKNANYQPSLAGQLKSFLEKYNLSGAVVANTISCRHAFIRHVSLPFRERAQIRKVLPYEVEQIIPLPLEDVVLDYQILGRNGRNQTSDVLVAAAPAIQIRDRLALSKEAGISKTLIDVDVFSLFAYLQYHRRYGQLPHNVAIIDIGASQTLVCLTLNGRPFSARTIMWGADSLTAATAQRYDCSYAQAEQEKRQLEAPHIEALEPFLNPLVDALRLTLHAYEGDTKTMIQHVWLCGGGSLLKGLKNYLADQLRLTLLSPTAPLYIKCPREYAVAFGSAIRAMSSWSNRVLWRKASYTVIAIDLSRVATRSSSRFQDITKRLFIHGIGIGVIAFLLFADLSIRMILAESRARQLKVTVQEQVRKEFPGIISDQDDLHQARLALQSLKKGLMELGLDQRSMVEILSGLSQAMPPSLVQKVTMLTIEDNAIHVEAEAASFEAVERVKEHVKQLPRLTDVKVSDARMGSLPNHVMFRLALIFESL